MHTTADGVLPCLTHARRHLPTPHRPCLIRQQQRTPTHAALTMFRTRTEAQSRVHWQQAYRHSAAPAPSPHGRQHQTGARLHISVRQQPSDRHQQVHREVPPAAWPAGCARRRAAEGHLRRSPGSCATGVYCTARAWHLALGYVPGGGCEADMVALPYPSMEVHAICFCWPC